MLTGPGHLTFWKASLSNGRLEHVRGKFLLRSPPVPARGDGGSDCEEDGSSTSSSSSFGDNSASSQHGVATAADAGDGSGRVISAARGGNLLLWEGDSTGEISVEITKKDGSRCHDGPVNQVSIINMRNDNNKNCI